MFKKMLSYFTLPLLLLLSNTSGNSAPQLPEKSSESQVGTRERLIVGSGTVAMDLDVNRLKGIDSGTQASKRVSVRFEVAPNSFFTILVFNNVLRGPELGSMGLIGGNSAVLPEPLNASPNQLVVEKIHSGEPFELVVRDGKTGFVFFNIEGHLYDYDAATHLLSINGGRLRVSEELANKLGHPAEAGFIVGEISIATTMYPIEITTFVNGAAESSILPPPSGRTPNVPEGSVPGPDIVVGDMNGLAQFGTSGTQVGLGTGATSCNNGDQPVHFYQLPDPDHSVVSQNLYRMSGGASNNDRFEQLGQSWNKHTFGAAQENACGFGCTPFPDQSELGVGCSDPYSASQNAFQGNTNNGALGSRAWINPFTGLFPVSPRPENHTGHTHIGTSHRLLVERNDLNTTLNAGATYYLEVQYDSPQEYAWCQAHPGQCNMYNNASYRRYNVSGTTGNFTFAAAGATVRMTPATGAWTGATSSTIEPAPGVDGRAFVVYKVTGPVAGIWHYEYAIHNQNLDRSIQSFSVPLGAGITVSNLGFHAPPNHPGFPNDGTVGNTGFSNAAWSSNQTADALSWNTETLAQNPNANAIRFGTLYNFRFDSDRPPQATNATIGFFKTGAPITVAIQGPSPDGDVTPTPTATATPTATGSPTVPPSPSPSLTPGATVTPTQTPTGSATPTPTGAAQPINLSTRMRVQTDAEVGIGGFIITGTTPKHVLLRAIGPSLTPFGVPNVLADPVMELHGPGGFVTITNDNWREDPVQEALIIATGIPPTNDLESAIDVNLAPGNYTAIVSGKNNTSGVALVEVYDLSQAVLSKLGNISTRAFVGTGSDIVIAGFILGGNSGNDTIVLRGLSVPGVPNPLADPNLELRDANGVLIASDNDWQDDPAQAAALTAAGLAPPSDLDAAIVATLPPSLYTALLSGRNNGTGIGLVEVYDLGSGAPVPTATPGGTPSPTTTPAASPTATSGGGGTPSPTPSSTPVVTPTPPTQPCVQNFDSVTAPAFPVGWTATNPDPGDGTMWVTTTVSSETAPNNAFIADQDGVSDKVLDRTGVSILSGSAVLTFRNNYLTEYDPPPAEVFWDGYVLEISSPNISGGAFLDFTDSHIGGSCVSGCYTGEIDGSASNPLAGRQAWCGDSGGYINTVINLGPNVAGQTITLRFRMGSDEALGRPGVHIDNIAITNAICLP